MKQLVHGGDWMGYRERFGRDALDFSANVKIGRASCRERV